VSDEKHVGDELVTIYEAPNAAVAGIIAGLLRSEGIACSVAGENQAGFPGVTAVAVSVLVRAEDADRARNILKRHEKLDETP
jgi:hypothetical protein